MQRLDSGTEIVLIEDNADDVATARRVAARCPVPVSLIVVADGRAALALLARSASAADGARGRRPHAILLDIGLPEMDGIEVLRRLKSERELQDIPTILLTGSQDERHIRNGQDLGAHGHIAKPISLEDFVWIATSVRNYWERISILSRLTAR